MPNPRSITEALIQDNTIVEKMGVTQISIERVTRALKESSETWAVNAKAQDSANAATSRNLATTMAMSKGYLEVDKSTTTFTISLKNAETQQKATQQQVDKNKRALDAMALASTSLNLGVNASALAMSAFGDSAGKSATAADVASVAMQGLALLANPTPLGLAAMGIGIVVGAIDQYKKAQEAALKPSRDLQQSILDIDDAQTDLGKKIQSVFAVKKEDADVMARAAGTSKDYRDGILELAAAQEEYVKQSQKQTWAGRAEEFISKTFNVSDAINILGDNAYLANKIVEQLYTGMTGLPFRNIFDAMSPKAPEKFATFVDVDKADSVLRNKQQLDALTVAIPKVQQAWVDYRDTLRDLAVTHRKNLEDLKEQKTTAETDAAEARVKLAEDTAKRISEIEAGLTRQITELAYSYNNQLANLMYSRYQQERDTAQRLAQIDRERAKSLRDSDESLGDDLNNAHTDREREKARLSSLIRRRDIEEARGEKLRELAEQKAARDEDFARQKSLMEEQNRHQRQNAIDAAEIQKKAANETAKAQGEAIEKALTKSLAAIAKRKEEEDAVYTAAQTKAKETRDKLIENLTDTRSEQEKFNDALKELSKDGGTYDKLTAKAISYYNVASLTAGLGFAIPPPSEPSISTRHGGEYSASGTGGWKTVPSGFPHDSYRLNLSSGERYNVVAPGHSSSGGSFNIDAEAQRIAEMVIGTLGNALARAADQKAAREFLR